MHGRMVGLLSVLTIGACGGAPYEESQSSQSVITDNGLKYNGLKYNGLKYNGLKYNGLKYNGMGLKTVGGVAGTDLVEVRLDKTTFIAKTQNGTTISGMGFLGATFVGMLENGSTVKVGIAEIKTTADKEVLHYRLQTWDARTSKWLDTCQPKEMAVPVAGLWKSDGSKVASSTEFTFACVQSSAIGKCVMMGYKPWTLADHHQACVRMVRADYCGDGKSYTQDGNVINVYDNKGIQKDDHASYTQYTWIFDAEWGPGGAVCVSKAGRPGGLDIPCARNFACKSGGRFADGVLLKNWTAVPDEYKSTSTDQNGNNFNYDVSGGGGQSIGGVGDYFKF